MDLQPFRPEPVLLGFTLPAELAAGLAPGRWHPCIHRITVTVTAEHVVMIEASDLMESHARVQAFDQMARFLKTLPKPARPLVLIAALTSASTRHPERYAVSFGARFSVARTDYAPMLFGDDFAPAMSAPAKRA